MRYVTIVLLIAICVFLGEILFKLNEIHEENSLRVTEIHHKYYYDIESYGTIRVAEKFSIATKKVN
jgi:hypothetical protein